MFIGRNAKPKEHLFRQLTGFLNLRGSNYLDGATHLNLEKYLHLKEDFPFVSRLDADFPKSEPVIDIFAL